MYMATKELLWLSQVLTFLCVPFTPPAYLYCDNTAALHIASNVVFHERTNQVEFDCHNVREAITRGHIKTMYVHTDNQLADGLTKALYPTPIRELVSKIGLHNIFAPLPS